jgi:NAD(P)-dependent dehydrogenase (short-subunit alcohol dehydrogenase family)
MNISFEGKVALVTGGASGIGLATAKAFAEAGASVAIVDVNAEAVERANADLGLGDRAAGIICDVAQEAAVEAMVAKVVETFGRIDFAFNNAGIHVPVANTADASTEDFDRLMAINLRGTWLCMKHELRQMREQGGPAAIVNCSSQNGITGAPGLGAYVTSKHAVIGMTRAAALEYARKDIRINVICPGAIDTPMVAKAMADHPKEMQATIDGIPLGRLGRGEEIASAVLWLCSPGASLMVGQIVAPDGGYTVL